MSTMYSNRIQTEPATSAVRPLSTALKTLALVDYLGARDRPVRLAEAAADLGGGRSTIYQRLVTLIEAGWVEQTEDGRFQLTMQVMKIAGAALAQAGLGERTLQTLRELVGETHETASLAVVQNGAAVIIQRVEAEGILQAGARIGASMSLRDSASGRILIAFADPEETDRLAKAGIALPEEKALRETRRTGLAVAAEHIVVRAIAAPVFDHSRRCIAALSLVGPKDRLDIEKVKAPLIAAADRLSVKLGGQAWPRDGGAFLSTGTDS